MFGFQRVWRGDTEYGAKPDGSFGPHPVCFVVTELYTGEKHRIWLDGVDPPEHPPFDIKNDLFIPYNATAELQCFIELGWPMPHNIIDLWVEYRAITNGKRSKGEKTKLINALARYKCDHIASVEKKEMQDRARRGAPWGPGEPDAMLDYCETDVDGLDSLLKSKMAEDLKALHPKEMLFRGRFMIAQTRSDRTRLPVDVPMVMAIAENREEIKLSVIAEYERKYGWKILDEDGELHWKSKDGQTGVLAWLGREGIKLPPTEKTKRPSISDKSLERASLEYPKLIPFHECLKTRNTLSSRFALAAGSPEADDPDNKGLIIDAEGYSRFFANNFSTTTGRDAKLGGQFIPSLPAWARFLMKPKPGFAIAYIDITAQEVLLAAVWSKCAKMLLDYYKDIYLQQAIRRGKAPAWATKKTHKKVRDLFKKLVLGPNYGMSAHGVAKGMDVLVEVARGYLGEYFADYPEFKAKRQAIANGTRLGGRRYFTSLGWPLWVDGLFAAKGGSRRAAIRAMLNHPMQAGGADWMRVVMIAATEAGIQVCFSLHDGFMILAPLDRIDADVAKMVTIIKGAGAALLGVPALVGEPEIVRYPDRYIPADPEGAGVHDTWRMIVNQLDRLGKLPEGFTCPIARPAEEERKIA